MLLFTYVNCFYAIVTIHIHYAGPEHIDYSSYSMHKAHSSSNLNRNSSVGSSGTGREVPEPEKSMRFSTWGARSLEHAGTYYLCLYYTVHFMRYTYSMYIYMA